MAGTHSTTPLDPRVSSHGSSSGSGSSSHLVGYHASLPQSNDQYKPLPPGCWTVNFHGNCPKCHHHNKALQVHVKVTPDVCHVNYVHCERCQDRWAAIGGRNVTRTSLLSTETTEPDPVARGVRYSLFDIVKLAREKQSLSILPESPSAASSQEESTVPNARAISRTSSPSVGTPASASTLDISDGSPVEADRTHQGIFHTINDQANHPEARISRRRRTLRLLYKFKINMTTRFPILRQGNFRRLIRPSRQPKMPSTQSEEFPVRTPPATTQGIVLAEQMPMTVPSTYNSVEELSNASDAFYTNVVEPSKRIAEVVAFVAGLDKSVLDSKSEGERIEWMRKEYTDFKASRQRRILPLGLSAIVHSSVPSEPACPSTGARSRVSIEVLGVGAQMENFQMIESLEAAFRAGSITISETISENAPTLDENQLSQRLHLLPGRPQSLPTTFHPPLHLQHWARNSYDARMSGEREATSSMSGQAPSRLSQGSTFWTSPRSDDRSMSQETLLQSTARDPLPVHEDSGRSLVSHLSSQDQSTLGRDA